MIKKKINYKHHLLFWIVFIMTFVILEWGYGHSFEKTLYQELIILPARMAVVYINWFILIPKFIKNNVFAIYFLQVMLLLLIFALIYRTYSLFYFIPLLFPERLPFNPVFLSFIRIFQISFMLLLALVFTSGWRLFLFWKERQEQTEALKSEKIETELKYLKSQINPHFLFNTLNNIYGLSLENSNKVPRLILKLSDFLSFSLYETNEKCVPLEKEIQLIKDFIELQISRFDDRVEAKVELPKITGNIFVPPMIFIPFVENAFKHSLKNETKIAKININLTINNDVIFFKVGNTKSSFKKPSLEKGGIGLANIKRRLDLLYGEKHKLEIKDDLHVFSVNLYIKNLNV